MAEDPYDEASRSLVAAVEVEVGPWIERCVLTLAPERADEAAVAARIAEREVVERLGALVAIDIDEQRGTPLEIVRGAARHATAVLAGADVPPVHRDPWQRQADPDDLYDLGPATWAVLGPASAEAGLVWGAAKAMRHLARHRPTD